MDAPLIDYSEDHLAAPSGVSTFNTRPTNDFNLPCPEYKQPEELTCFTYDGQRQFHYNDHGLRYYHPPDLVADLNDGFESRYAQRDRDIPDHLDGLLSALVELRQREPDKRPATAADVMCYRGVMTRIMCAPYERRDPWELGVSRHKGTLYIEEREAPANRQRRVNATRRSQMMGYWGYKFEALCTLDKHPSTLMPNDPALAARKRTGVNTNEQYCSVFRTRLGKHRLVMGAEVDCTSDVKDPAHPTAGYIELKTTRLLTTPRDQHFFKKDKLIKYWLQSFLAGVPRIIVGFRDDRGKVRGIGKYKTLEIPRQVRNLPDMWASTFTIGSPNVCMNFGEQFLDWLKTVITVDDPAIVYRVSFNEPWTAIEVLCEGRIGTFLTEEYLASEEAVPL